MASFDADKRAAELEWWRHWFDLLGGEEGFIAQRRDDLRDRTEFFPQALQETGLGLDLGCGLVSIFEFSNLNVIAADPLAEEYHQVFRYPGSRLPYVQTAYETLPFADGHFHYVFCLNVIDHTPDPQLLVDEIYRVLKPGGRLYFHVYFDRELTAPHYGLWRSETVQLHFAQFKLCQQRCRIEQGDRTSYFAVYERLNSPPQLPLSTAEQATSDAMPACDPDRVMLIPRVFHRVWLGSKPMPDELISYGQGWLQHHPGWEMRTWTDANLPKLINDDIFRECRSYSEKSDVIRYEVLFQFGGVYLDTDVECHKNIEPLIAGVSAFAAIEDWDVVGTAIVGGAIGHPLFLEIIRGAAESFRKHEGDPVASMGPKYLSRCVFEFLDRNPGDVLVFDKCFFYPYGHWEKHRRNEPFPWAFAIHHWLGSWCQ